MHAYRPAAPDLDRALTQPIEICFKAFDRGALEPRIAPHHAVSEHHKFRRTQYPRHHHPRTFRRCATHRIIHYLCLDHPRPPHITDASKAMMLIRGGYHTFKAHPIAPGHARALDRQQRQCRHAAEHRWRVHPSLLHGAFLKHFTAYAPQLPALFRFAHTRNPSTGPTSTPTAPHQLWICGYARSISAIVGWASSATNLHRLRKIQHTMAQCRIQRRWPQEGPPHNRRYTPTS